MVDREGTAEKTAGRTCNGTARTRISNSRHEFVKTGPVRTERRMCVMRMVCVLQ